MISLRFIPFAPLWILKSAKLLTAVKSVKAFIFSNVKSAINLRLFRSGANQGFVIVAVINIKNSEPRQLKANSSTATTGISFLLSPRN